MDFIAIVLFLLSVLVAICSVFYFALNQVYGFPVSGLSLVVLAFILFCSSVFLFVFWERHLLRGLNKNHFSLSKKISSLSKEDCVVTFSKNNGTWCFNDKSLIVPFELRWTVFKKSFIVAFVNRAIRYNLVSNRLPIKFLGHFILKGFNTKLVVQIQFSNAKRLQAITVLKNGKSSSNFMSWAITKCKTPPSAEYRKPLKQAGGNLIYHIDEEWFCKH